MISKLRIRDFAIIDELELSLAPGFVVFTGETGAGKSIIIDAVEQLLGARADTGMVRTGASAAIIEGEFQLDDVVRDEVSTILDREGLQDQVGFVILAREIRTEGRNICRVNGRTVTLSLLDEIGSRLVDVHGQSEHLSLLRTPEHLHLLDRFADNDELLSTYSRCFQEYKELAQERDELYRQEQDATRRSEFLRYQINEIEAANLNPNEEEDLVDERNRLANAEQLAMLTDHAIEALAGETEARRSASDLLAEATSDADRLSHIDANIEPIAQDAQAILENMSDLTRRLRLYRESIEFNPTRLDQVEERLGLISSLKRKYGEDIPAILVSLENVRTELDAITHAEERLQQLDSMLSKSLEELGQHGSELSQARRKAGEALSNKIADELGELKMEGAQFAVDFQWKEDPGGVPIDGQQIAFDATGLDQVQFLVAPNPGEGLKPLTKIASGGETSRLMLALKSVLAQADRTPSLIFDEIDQGIGGRVGAIVGSKLWRLTTDHQVLCVTHLPQLAAYGDQHLRVEKIVDEGRTMTRAVPLDEVAKTSEMASMLGALNDPNLESAGELLRTAAEEKVQPRLVPSE